MSLRPPQLSSTDRPNPVKLSDQIYELVLNSIVEGSYPESSKLPTETELARRFGVSRPVIREALARLRDDGLIQSRKGAGSFVRRRPDEAVLRFSPVGSIADIQRCFEFRVALEPHAAQLAAERRDENSLRRIAQALASLDKAVETGSLGVDADFEFHLAVALASENRFFLTTFTSLQEPARTGMSINRNLSLLNPAERLGLVQLEHVAVYEAIRLGLADEAREAMLRHIENARRRVFEGRSG